VPAHCLVVPWGFKSDKRELVVQNIAILHFNRLNPSSLITTSEALLSGIVHHNVTASS
jgi:hypothetical protein